MVNQVVLWDKIILRGEKADLKFQAISPKYQFIDDGYGMRLFVHTSHNTVCTPLHSSFAL